MFLALGSDYRSRQCLSLVPLASHRTLLVAPPRALTLFDAANGFFAFYVVKIEVRALRPLIYVFALSRILAADDVDLMNVTGTDFK